MATNNTTLISPAWWGTPVGVTSQPALPANSTRAGLIVINSGTVAVAICGLTVNQGVAGVYPGFTPGVPAINGPGSVTMQPGDKFIFDTVAATTGLLAIAGGAGGALTFLEHF